MQFKDYYQILGVARDAPPDEIKRSYRRLARRFHPDVSKEANAEARFKEVQEAYEVLKDPEKRAAYDQFGANWKAGQDFEPPPEWAHDFSFDGASFGDAGQFSDFFESLFGHGRAQPGRGRSGYTRVRMKGEDIDASITIPIEDAYRGTTRSLNVQVPEPDRHGALVPRVRTLNVKIPKGVKAGQRIRLEGQGGPGFGGAPAGDLYLKVQFAPHRLYRAEGHDVYLTLPIAPWEAALGRTITVPTLGGNVDLKVPEGASSGQKLRLKGRGLPAKTPGDQYVLLDIVVPKANSAEARALYERLERELKFNPRATLGV